MIYNSPDLHTACRTFPAMAEEELAETMYWEQDRIFGVREDLRLFMESVSEDVTGWTVSLAGVREDSVACWRSAAEKCQEKNNPVHTRDGGGTSAGAAAAVFVWERKVRALPLP